MSYAVSNGWLQVQSGVALDDELTFLSRQTFSVPMRAMVAVNLSQRIVGQSVYAEFVSLDDAGALDSSSAIAWRLDGLTATNGVYEVSTGSNPRLSSNPVTIPTTSPGATNVFSAVELESFADESWFHARGMDSSSARSNSYVRHQQILNPDKQYKLRLRVVNRQSLEGITAVAAGTANAVRITRAAHGSTNGESITVSNLAGVTGTTFPWTGAAIVVDVNTVELTGTSFGGAWINTGWSTITRNVAPLSNTVVGFNFATVTDYAELTAEITAGRGNSAAGQGLYVNAGIVGGNVTILGQGSDVSGTSPIPTAVARSALPTVMTTGRSVAPSTTLVGSLIVKAYSIPEQDWQYAAASGGIIHNTDVSVKAAAGSMLRNYVTGFSVMNTSATPTEFLVKDGAVVIWRSFLPANMTSNVDMDFPTPLRGSLNTAINVQCVTSGALVYCNAQGFAAP